MIYRDVFSKMNLKIIKQFKYFYRIINKFFFFKLNYYLKLLIHLRVINILKKNLIDKNEILTFIETSNIGGSCLMYLSILEYAEKNNIRNNNIVVYIDDDGHANNFFIKKFRQKLKIISNKKIFKILSNDFLIIYFEKINLGFRPFINYVNFNLKERYMEFNIDEKTFFNSICHKINLDLSKKIVAVGFKNNDYYLKKIIKNYDYENYRVSDYKKLIKSIKYLKQKDYQIILLGYYNEKITRGASY